MGKRGDVVDQSLVGGEVVLVEPRDGGTDVALGERGRGVDGAGEEALAERAERTFDLVDE
ncbi:hypothetical protein ACOBQB_08025 [Streptomyces sp. G5(2025)]|uniref:hypothetical protein n=1 Tax=Streptomyces sp. G5(2025) TaxID=3406628 RepID=UPI003C1AB9DB